MWELVEYEGCLAVALHWSLDWTEPVRVRTLWVNRKEKWVESYYKEFVDLQLVNGSSFIAWNTRNGRYSGLDITGWEQVNQREQVPIPSRGGKDWEWTWHYGKWTKTWRASNLTAES